MYNIHCIWQIQSKVILIGSLERQFADIVRRPIAMTSETMVEMLYQLRISLINGMMLSASD